MLGKIIGISREPIAKGHLQEQVDLGGVAKVIGDGSLADQMVEVGVEVPGGNWDKVVWSASSANEEDEEDGELIELKNYSFGLHFGN